jgi:hypothetical protein
MLTKWISACSTAAVLVTLARPAAQTQRPGDKAAAAEQPSVAELWSEPEPDRDLYYGVGGKRLAPDPAETYTVLAIKLRGFSEGYTLSDSTEREWSAKLPPEAVTEVVASRLLWGVGFHQPPLYLVREWKARGATAPNPQLPARFREKKPDFHGIDAGEPWSFKDNPFVGTRELAGLLVLQAIIENPDLKTSNNTIYKLNAPVEGAKHWYVIRDLGYSFGRAAFNSPRADIDAFERAPFIRGVTGGKVRFYFGGQYKSRLDDIKVADVHWICERLSRLTDQQWRDAFRAAAYESTIAERHIARLPARVAEGLALREGP